MGTSTHTRWGEVLREGTGSRDPRTGATICSPVGHILFSGMGKGLKKNDCTDTAESNNMGTASEWRVFVLIFPKKYQPDGEIYRKTIVYMISVARFRRHCCISTARRMRSPIGLPLIFSCQIAGFVSGNPP